MRRINEWVLYILMFSLPFSKSMVEICSIALISYFCFRKLFFSEERFKLPQTDLNLPIIAFFLVNLLSVFWSTHPEISIKAFTRKIAEYVALYFIVFETVKEKRIARNLILAVAVSAFIMSIDAFFQKITGHDFIRGYGMYGLTRVTSAFEFPTGFSAWLLLVSFPLISLTVFYKKTSRLTKISSILLSVFLVASLILTSSRGAIISFLLILFLMFFLMGGKKYRTVCVTLILIIALLMIVLPERIKAPLGLSSLFSYGVSAQHRLSMWRTAWRMFLDRPILGQGLNTFMANYVRFKIPKDRAAGIWYAHNCFLQIAAETGILGLLSFLWLVGAMAIISLKSWRLITDDFLKFLCLGLFSGLAAFLIHSSVETSLYSLKLVVLFYMLLGLLMAVKNIAVSKGEDG